jgi:two-component system sensor histidine kinase ChvG
MPALATAGSSKAKPGEAVVPALGRVRARMSLVAKAALLAAIFLFVPLILYDQFRAADQQKRDLMMASVRDQGEIVAVAMLPLLTANEEPNLPAIGQELARFGNKLTTIKLLLRPASGTGGFFYVASSAALSIEALEVERARLKDQGVLGQLEESCSEEHPVQLRYTAPDGHDEVVLSVVPVHAQNGCWAIVTSLSAAALLGVAIDVPYYDTPEVRVAGIIYLLMAMLTLTTFWTIWRGLLRFGERARAIGTTASSGPGFRARNDVPELAGVAEEFDRMVETLQNAARDLRRTAEDNAHAYKTPVAIIRQSLEPVSRALPPDNPRAQRALGLIEQALDKLDGLVASARRLDEAAAALLDTPRADIDLSHLLDRVLAGHGELIRQREMQLQQQIAAGVTVRGSAEMIEIVVENILENALSFGTPGGIVRVTLMTEGEHAAIVISDDGPGVSPTDLPRIFDRYVSSRASSDEEHAMHFGVGLWIVRRNVEALGGTVVARNREPHGLEMRIHLPLKRNQRGEMQR